MILVISIYVMVLRLNQRVTDSTEEASFEQLFYLFLVGILNGALNFLLSRAYEFTIKYLVDWENHM